MNKKRKQTLNEAAAHHRESLRQNLQRRLAVAKDNGDEELLRQLEAEASYLHLL